MPRHQPARTGTGEPIGEKVKMRLDKNGRFVPVLPERDTTETIESAERPPTPDDPRPAAYRNIPPFGGAI
jgi:hypothetical protein